MDRQEQNDIAALTLGFSGRQLSPEQTAQGLGVLETTELLRTVERNATKKGCEERTVEIGEGMLVVGDRVEKVVTITRLARDVSQPRTFGWDRGAAIAFVTEPI